ncbi:MAG: 50S ribosomal protein L22 [archaeon]|nr:50S ribosomal protein L22 [archaeon]
MKTTQNSINEQSAVAKALNVPISSKQSFEISRHLRYKKTAFAKKFLEDVIALRKAVPFKRAIRDVGHKAGMSSGRYPQKAAKEFLKLIKSVEANAQNKGLSTTNLTITKLLANKASIPFQGGRFRRGSKRAHIEIMVEERTARAKAVKAEKGEKIEPKTTPKEIKTEIKTETKVESTTPKVKPSKVVEEPVVKQESQSADILLEKAMKQNVKVAPKKEATVGTKKSERGSDADNNEATRLYEELKKKGTLRGNPVTGESK